MRHVGGKRQEDFHTVMCLKKKKRWKRSYSMFVKPCGFCSGHSVNFRALAKGMVLEKPRYQLPRPLSSFRFGQWSHHGREASGPGVSVRNSQTYRLCMAGGVGH